MRADGHGTTCLPPCYATRHFAAASEYGFVQRADLLGMIVTVHRALEVCISQGCSQDEAVQEVCSSGLPRQLCELVWTQLKRQNPDFFLYYEAAVRRAKAKLDLEDDATSRPRV